MTWIAYTFGTVFAAVAAAMLAVVAVTSLLDAVSYLGQRLSFRLRQAFGMCKNKFRNTYWTE